MPAYGKTPRLLRHIIKSIGRDAERSHAAGYASSGRNGVLVGEEAQGSAKSGVGGSAREKSSALKSAAHGGLYGNKAPDHVPKTPKPVAKTRTATKKRIEGQINDERRIGTPRNSAMQAIPRDGEHGIVPRRANVIRRIDAPMVFRKMNASDRAGDQSDHARRKEPAAEEAFRIRKHMVGDPVGDKGASPQLKEAMVRHLLASPALKTADEAFEHTDAKLVQEAPHHVRYPSTPSRQLSESVLRRAVADSTHVLPISTNVKRSMQWRSRIQKRRGRSLVVIRKYIRPEKTSKHDLQGPIAASTSVPLSHISASANKAGRWKSLSRRRRSLNVRVRTYLSNHNMSEGDRGSKGPPLYRVYIARVKAEDDNERKGLDLDGLIAEAGRKISEEDAGQSKAPSNSSSRDVSGRIRKILASLQADADHSRICFVSSDQQLARQSFKSGKEQIGETSQAASDLYDNEKSDLALLDGSLSDIINEITASTVLNKGDKTFRFTIEKVHRPGTASRRAKHSITLPRVVTGRSGRMVRSSRSAIRAKARLR